MAIITAERPRPSLGDAQWPFQFQRVFEPQSSHRGEYGCAYTHDKPPGTCANFLRCNRQIYHEMGEAIRLAFGKGLVSVRLDCIAEDESFHYFSWLKIPLVKTTWNTKDAKQSIMPIWADRMMERYSHRILSKRCQECQMASTLIHQLWIDVRLFGNRSGKWFRNTSPPDRTSWAICAALKRIFEKGPDFSRLTDSANVIMVDELVLNIVTPPGVPKARYLEEDFPTDGLRDGLVHPQTVAKELVDVWNRIWAADDYKGTFYQILLERIKRVRICINEETWRVRELRLELERGQAERRRIAARVGW
ncbi:hypothetical protein K491DRAFT_686894 [Lophiostoma macrostomum CBS 122681]|uniref:Uncharacterized protein n=1 Tax=Lophiostoma macrostomum CBS 122681 TaxID=1314788 RepID=A0A6A6TTG1_9PLEO|nr:hypothetical protein K491DRAFT_686894 [Lophiostoma macrostomum CBS 122681]